MYQLYSMTVQSGYKVTSPRAVWLVKVSISTLSLRFVLSRVFLYSIGP